MKDKFIKIITTIIVCLLFSGCNTTNSFFTENPNIVQENNTEYENKEYENKEKDNTETCFEEELEIYILDVGQGSACFIRCNDSCMLIDAGENSCETLIVDYLKQLDVNHLDYIIGTHPDSDHIGGLDAVIRNFDIDNVFLSGITDKDTKTSNSVLTELEAKEMTYCTPEVGSIYNLGDATFIILAPNKHYDNANDNSIAIKLSYGEFDFLTTGDCEVSAEADIISLNYDITAEVYNAGHHGSSNASSEAFLDKVQPIAVTISCGKDNKYNHPHDKTMQRFFDRNITTYRTDELGTIVITSDGINFTVNGMIINSKNYEELPNIEGNETDDNIQPEPDTNIENTETMVWITATGSKYHTENCRTLTSSKLEVTLEEALNKGLEPCKICY